MDKLIIGSGGGGKSGGGSGRTAVEAPNNLKSIQYAKIIDVISEGEILGLVDGPRSIFLDDVPLSEFSDAVYEIRTGTQDQTSTNLALEGSKTSIDVGSLVRYVLEDGVTSGHVIRTIEASNFDAGIASIDVTVGIPALTYQDISNGDVSGTTVNFLISVAPNGGTYSVVHDTSISGKCTSMYNASYNVPISDYTRAQYPLSIKVTRTIPDSTKSNLQNQIYWSSYTLNFPTKLSYPNTALATLSIDSDHFTSVPTRAYEIYGIKIRVPTNYDPVTRVYTGSWDGTFKTAWSNNPAWIYYDLATDTRYGIGEYITEDKIDKWELYTIAKYCDELVPDGYGGYEPRFTCNTYIQNQDEAYKALSDLCSIFRGMQYWAGGYFSVAADMPKDAASIFTTSNVIDGVFNYSGSSLKTRHTAVKVIWNDPTDAYKQKIEYVEATGFVYDQNNPNYAFKPINTYGIVQTDIAGIGCTSRGQANRVGRWLLYTELYETETVTFKTGIENAILLPGTIISTADPFRQGKRLGGRVQEVLSPISLILDVMEGDLVNGAYSISFVAPIVDTNTQINKSSIITYSGILSTLNNKKVFTLSIGTLDTAITENIIWIASIPEVIEPEMWRIVSIVQEDETTATIVALEYHPGKFDAIEQGLLLEERPVSQIDYGRPSTPVTNSSTTRGTVTDINYSSVMTTLTNDISDIETTIPCTTTENFSTSGFIRVNNELMQYSGITSNSFTGVTRGTEGLIVPSMYHISGSTIVQATKTNLGTGWVQEYLYYQAPGLLSTAAILSWTANSLSYEIKYRLIDTTIIAWESKISNVPTIELKPLQAGTYDIEIVAINALGRRSEPLKRTINILGKSAPPLNITNFICSKEPTGLALTWDANDSTSLTYPDLDLAGYEIRERYYVSLPDTMQELDSQVIWSAFATEAQKEAEWNAASAAKVTDGLITTTNYTDISVNANKYNVFLIKARDTSGNYSSTSSICGVKINPPQQIEITNSYINGTDLVISWKPPVSDIGIDYYTISYVNGSGSVITRCETPEFRKKLWFTGYELFEIIAYDMGGNTSLAKIVEVTVNTIPSPSLFTNIISGENYVLSWVAPEASNTAPVNYYEIRTDLNWGQSDGLLTTTSSTGYSAKVDWSGNRNIYLAAKDTTGTYGISTSTSINSPIPGQVHSFTPTVVDNNILFTWAEPSVGMELPIIEYELRKGDSWATASLIGTKQGLFTTNFETVAGTYTYWIAAINSANTYGVPRSCIAIVNQPPDYVLATNYFSIFESINNLSVTYSNAQKTIDGSLILPINTSETWESHFVSSGFDQISDFGNNIFVYPGELSGYYQEVMDLGSTISGSTVSIVLGTQAINGTPYINYEVSVSSDNITYTAVSNTLINYFTQFRYIKFKLTVTNGIAKINSLNIKIDVKQKTDSGSRTCLYSDAGGSTVYLTDDRLSTGNKLFKDVIAINLTPNIGCTDRLGTVVNTVTAIYDFVDIADPLSFKILLYNSTNGDRLSGSCSYTIRGI